MLVGLNEIEKKLFILQLAWEQMFEVWRLADGLRQL
jgi:hypothetical protein